MMDPKSTSPKPLPPKPGAQTPESAVGRDGGSAPMQPMTEIQKTAVSLAAEGRKNRITQDTPL